MKILAKAIPNKEYINIRNLSDVIIEARLENNKISYLETHTKNPNWVVELKEETLLYLFEDEEKSKNDVPFLIKENHDFAIVLYQEANKEAYAKLKQKILHE